MSSFKYLLVAVLALVNVANSSTAFSSELKPAVTSVQYVTSVTLVSALASTSSNKACEVATVTESTAIPSSAVTVPGHYGGSTAMSSATLNVTKTVTTSSTRTVTRTSSKMNHTITTMTDATETSMVSAPTLTFSSSHHGNASTTTGTANSTTAVVTETSGSAMISATYAAPNNSMPLFTAAADATNVGAVVLAGGFLMALGF